MSKLWEMGRKAMLYIRVLSGYEERCIRSYRLKLDQRLRSAQERKEAVKKIPEQVILSEVRQMVEEMQNLNKSLEELDNSINDYFSPIDKDVGNIMNMKMEREKMRMEMMKQAVLERAKTQAVAQASSDDQTKMETMSPVSMFKQAVMQKPEQEAATEASNPPKQAAQ